MISRLIRALLFFLWFALPYALFGGLILWTIGLLLSCLFAVPGLHIGYALSCVIFFIINMFMYLGSED